MKKSIIILLVVSLIGTLFMSCNNEMTPTQAVDAKAKVFVNTAVGKELSTDGASLNELDVNDLYWYYSAEKTSGPFVYGTTACAPVKTDNNAATTGLSNAELGEFSLGGWHLVFKGFLNTIESTAFETADAVYTTEATFTLEDDLNLTLYLEEGEGMPGNGIKISNGLDYYAQNLADPTVARLYIYEGSTLIAGPISPDNNGAVDEDGHITFTSDASYNLPVGEHTITFKVTVPGEGETLVEIGSAPILINVAKGVTQTLSGLIAADDAQSNITITTYAVAYTLTYNVNGGEALETGTKRVVNGQAYGELPTPTREGYTFLGWYTAATNGTHITADTVVDIQENQTVYAHWAANRTVTLDAHGGECSDESVTVADGMAYGTLPTPTKAGYTFAGWYTAETEGTEVESTTVNDRGEDHTLYAHWTANTIYVHLNPNHDNIIPTQFTFTYGQTYGTGDNGAGLPTPERSGYNFLGWFTAAENGTEVTNDSYSIEPDDHFLYAHWELEEIIISFMNPLGSVCYDMQVTPGQAIVMPGAEHAGNYPDFVFKDYWTSEPDGQGTQYTPGQEYSFQTDTTLYGAYDKIVRVNFAANGGSVDPLYVSVLVGDTYGDLPTPEKEGYNFLGWFTDFIGGEQVTSETECTETEDHTLIAHWGEASQEASQEAFQEDLGEQYGEVLYSTEIELTIDSPPYFNSVNTDFEGHIYGLPSAGDLAGTLGNNYTFEGWYTSGNIKITNGMIYRSGFGTELFGRVTEQIVDPWLL